MLVKHRSIILAEILFVAAVYRRYNLVRAMQILMLDDDQNGTAYSRIGLTYSMNNIFKNTTSRIQNSFIIIPAILNDFNTTFLTLASYKNVSCL